MIEMKIKDFVQIIWINNHKENKVKGKNKNRKKKTKRLSKQVIMRRKQEKHT